MAFRLIMNINVIRKTTSVGLIVLFSQMATDARATHDCDGHSCRYKEAAGTGDDTVLQAEVSNFFSNIFDTSPWPPRWECGHWSEFHGWLYILSDIGIWAAYFAIPLILGFFLYRKANSWMPFSGIFLLFITFILACGLTHLIDAVIFWVPIYKFSAVIRFATAVVSISTVFALIRITPKVIELKTPEQFERLVDERTNALEKVNLNLAKEIAEKEEARAESRLLLESLPLIAWVANAEGKITYVNSRWKEYTGLTKLDGPSFNMVVHPDDAVEAWNRWRQSIQSGEDYIQEQRFRSKNGDYKYFLVKAIPIKDATGKIIKWIGTSTDIGEQKKNEQRRDTFLNIASHELKTPLTSIKAYLELLKDISTDLQEPAATYLEKAFNNTNKLNNLISELLDVSRVQAGKMDLHKQKFNLRELVNEVVEIYRHRTDDHEIILNGDMSLTVLADKNRIEQVINNLMSNAIKYSPPSSQVVITISSEERLAKVEVKDFGIGISKAEQGKLFQQFYRSENAARSVDGLGMGLYISQEIAKVHGGEIAVQSSEEKGSTFTLILPL